MEIFLWFEGTSYFPSLIIRSRIWVVGPALDNDFRVGFFPLLLWLWSSYQTKGYFLGVYREPAMWALLGCEEPDIHRVGPQSADCSEAIRR